MLIKDMMTMNRNLKWDTRVTMKDPLNKNYNFYVRTQAK